MPLFFQLLYTNRERIASMLSLHQQHHLWLLTTLFVFFFSTLLHFWEPEWICFRKLLAWFSPEVVIKRITIWARRGSSIGLYEVLFQLLSWKILNQIWPMTRCTIIDEDPIFSFQSYIYAWQNIVNILNIL